ncbi:putative Adenylate cyclase [Modestobacter italicus]|uniref:Adenylate cyclase n=1 Tax=Modestobacter italicus (strain DSM 44449 / CECT 9708 / BC 501) TaxID=2732864 RepID=I4EXN4_MODI5|nr:putative Adenylate cyclase [Modestobacter marinus]
MARNVTTGAGQQPEDGALPTGTVTFLFTDIAGSTRLLREDRREYAAALADHRTVVRAAVAAHGGREVDTQGDSFMVAFPAATEAVAAAAEAQLSLAAHPWPESARVRVRMGLHSGEATLAGGGYVGLAVHRAARIAAAAAGGQVLLSEATAALVGDEPPSGTAVRSLGRHALKDFPEPAGLYQLDVEGLPTSFPAPATLSQHRRRPLPVPVGEVLGRDEDLPVLEALLTDPGTRLVTVTGPGGVGKTRLALEAARAVAGAFPDGVVFVPLSALTDPSLVLPTVADAVGARATPGWRRWTRSERHSARTGCCWCWTTSSRWWRPPATSRPCWRRCRPSSCWSPAGRRCASGPSGSTPWHPWPPPRRSGCSPSAQPPSTPASRWTRATRPSSPRSADGSTGSRWPSSSPPPGSGCCPLLRCWPASPSGWT